MSTAPITDGLRAMLIAFRDSGHSTNVVSNNSVVAVDAFIAAHDLQDLIRAVIARKTSDPLLLKPNAHLINEAIAENQTNPACCVLVGDSSTDIIAAKNAGIATIAYANRPQKLDMLRAFGPEIIITHLDTLTRAATVGPHR